MQIIFPVYHEDKYMNRSGYILITVAAVLVALAVTVFVVKSRNAGTNDEASKAPEQVTVTDRQESLEEYLEEAVEDAGKTEERTAENNSEDRSRGSSESDSQNNSASNSESNSQDNSENNFIPAPDFTMTDQYGNVHSLADYRGKTIFLNFWATWCPPCRAEMPDIQALYEEYSSQEDPEVVILGIAFPNYNNEQDVAGVTTFLEENGYTYPVLMDEGATMLLPYYITAYPTTFLINPDGNVLGYIPGAMTKETMKDVIAQALEYAD